MRFWGTVALGALLIYAITTIWVPERWAWSAFQIGVFGLAAAWMARAAVSGERIVGTLVLMPLAGAVAWGLAQIVGGHTIYRWITWVSLLNWATFLAVALVALETFAEPRVRHKFLRAVTYFGLVLSVVSTIQMFTSQGKIFWLFPSGYTELVLGPFVYRNQYAAFIELLLPLAMWQALTERRNAWVYWLTAGVMFASVVAGASRAGAILAAAEMIVVLLLAITRGTLSGRQAGLAFGKLLLATVLVTSVVGWDSLWNRFQQGDPYAIRRELLWSSVDMAREKPLWGFGLGTWPVAYPRYAYFDDGTYANQAHNDWAQWAVEGGIPLLLLMMTLAAIVFRPAVRSLWGIGVLSVLVHCLVDYPLQQRPALGAWFFLFAAMVVQADRQRCGKRCQLAPPNLVS